MIVVSADEYNEEINKAYKQLRATAADDEERPAALQLCFDWYEEQEIDRSQSGTRSSRSIAARMTAARHELTTLVCTCHSPHVILRLTHALGILL